MIIYKVGEADAGERWFPTQAKAYLCAKAYGGTVQAITAGEDGREGMCVMLNEAEMTIAERFGDEAVSAAPAELKGPVTSTGIQMGLTPAEEGYAAKACRFEEEFDAMPLATQLHYAAKAMENAREAL